MRVSQVFASCVLLCIVTVAAPYAQGGLIIDETLTGQQGKVNTNERPFFFFDPSIGLFGGAGTWSTCLAAPRSMPSP
jgi:hypothetical protein